MKIYLSLATFILFSKMLFSQNYNVEESIFQNDSLDLYADIFIPNKPNIPKTGIAIIQGSGNSGRDNSWSRAYAEFLAENGYYVLLPDKRGSGKSEGDWKTASFQDLADDGLVSVKHLNKEYNLSETGVLGLSQGGFIVPMMASRDTTIAFVINVVGAAVTLEEQIVHEVSNTARKEGLNPTEIKEVLYLHILMKEYVRTRNWEPLGNRFEELKKSSWAEFAQTFPNSPDIWVWEWIEMNFHFDPIPYWKETTQPVFVTYGSKDQEDNMPVYESVYRLQKTFSENGKENYSINVYDTGHAMYEDDKAELRKEFLKDLLIWLKELQ